MNNKVFAALLSLVMVVLVTTWLGAQFKPDMKGQQQEVPFANKGAATQIVLWRNAAGTDTTIRLFTAAVNLRDTSRQVFWVGGATTISVVDCFHVKEDSALVRVYVQFSNDGKMWFKQTVGEGPDDVSTPTHTSNAMASFDSSGALDTPDADDFFVRGVNIASPPTWANYMRVIAGKRVSAATDSMYLKSVVTIHFGDE